MEKYSKVFHPKCEVCKSRAEYVSKNGFYFCEIHANLLP